MDNIVAIIVPTNVLMNVVMNILFLLLSSIIPSIIPTKRIKGPMEVELPMNDEKVTIASIPMIIAFMFMYSLMLIVSPSYNS